RAFHGKEQKTGLPAENKGLTFSGRPDESVGGTTPVHSTRVCDGKPESRIHRRVRVAQRPNNAAIGSAEEIGDAHIGLATFACADILAWRVAQIICSAIRIDVSQTRDGQAGPGVFLGTRRVQSQKDGAVLSTENVRFARADYF